MSTVLRIRASNSSSAPPYTVLCPGYEGRNWRDQESIDDLFDRHLTSFALSYTKFERIDGATAAQSLRLAAKSVYASEKYERRGEFGELILHGALVDFFGAYPAVSKIFYKDSDNDTVKGFDSVHLVQSEAGDEIWLGEAKFYKDAGAAARDAASSIATHLDSNFLRREFVAITNKIDPAWPHAERTTAMLHESESLDDITSSIVMPVLMTYDSAVIGNWDSHSAGYVAELAVEAKRAWSHFARHAQLNNLTVTMHIILVPLNEKYEYQKLMHQKLRHWQHI